MIRHGPALAFASKGQSFYPPPKDGERPYELSGGREYFAFYYQAKLNSDCEYTFSSRHKVEMWGGYFTSIRPVPQRLIVNMDRTAMAFIQVSGPS